DRRGHAEHDGVERRAGQRGRHVQPLAEEGAPCLLHAGLEEVRPPGGERLHHPRHAVRAENSEALLGERHREREADVAETDDADARHSSSPSATSRSALWKSSSRPTSSQYSRIVSAATTEPPSTSAPSR